MKHPAGIFIEISLKSLFQCSLFRCSELEFNHKVISSLIFSDYCLHDTGFDFVYDTSSMRPSMSIAAIVFLIIIVKLFNTFLVIQHQYRKSAPFQVRANFEPLSAPLQRGIRFFQHPLPAYPSAVLANCFPHNMNLCGNNRVYHVPLILLNDLGFAYPPGESQTTRHETGTCRPYPLPFGSSLSASLACCR